MVFVLLVLMAFAVCCTRARSGNSYKPKATEGHTLQNVPLLPYWIPFAGHFFSLLASPNRFLEKSRYVKHSS